MRQRGIVVEISEGNKVIVLTSQGEFVHLSFSKPVSVGQEVQFSVGTRSSLWRWSMVAVLFLALVGSANYVNEHLLPFSKGEASYFVTLDINPSIELAVNADHRVLYADGLNAEGRALLENVRVSGRPFKAAVEAISEQAKLAGYLGDGGHGIVVTISSVGSTASKVASFEDLKAQKQCVDAFKELEDVIRETLTALQGTVEIWQVPVDMREEVRERGISPRQYVAIHIRATEDNAVPLASIAVELEDKEVRVIEFQIQRPVLTSEGIQLSTSAKSTGFAIGLIGKRGTDGEGDE